MSSKGLDLDYSDNNPAIINRYTPTTERDFTTVYQNKTGKNLFVQVTCIQVLEIGEFSILSLRVSPNPAPVSGEFVEAAGQNVSQAGEQVSQYINVNAIVPPDHYYQLIASFIPATLSIQRWIETTL